MTDAAAAKSAPDALKSWREAQDPKLSFEAAGAKVGVSGSAWFDWEAGKKVPTVDLAEDIEELTCGAVTVGMWGEIAREKRLAQKAERERRKAAGGAG